MTKTKIKEITDSIVEYITSSNQDTEKYSISKMELINEIEEYGCEYNNPDAMLVNSAIRHMKYTLGLDNTTTLSSLNDIGLTEEEIDKYYMKYDIVKAYRSDKERYGLETIMTKPEKYLPEKCYSVNSIDNSIILIKRGQGGYYKTSGHRPSSFYESSEIVEMLNKKLGVTKEQQMLMETGSMSWWGESKIGYEPNPNQDKPNNHKSINKKETALDI